MNATDLPDAQDVIRFWDNLRRRGARLIFGSNGAAATFYPAPGTPPAESARQLEALQSAWPVLVRTLRPGAISAADAQNQRRAAPNAWDAAGQAIERARKPSEPITPAGAGNPTRKRETRP